MREWIDENTGRKVRQLTDFAEGATTEYFRQPRDLPGGLFLAFPGGSNDLLMIDPESGDIQRRTLPTARRLKVRVSDGRLWYVGEPDWRSIWYADLPSGEPRLIRKLPEDVPGHFIDITCDGRYLITGVTEEKGEKPPMTLSMDAEGLWRYLERPRAGKIWSYDLVTGDLKLMVESDRWGFGHHDTSPTDPTLLKYSLDAYDALNQRIWSVRVDGSQLTKIRPQERGEFVTHEFWWPGGQRIGYTYQDRRKDDTIRKTPWGEYAPVPTRLGIAGLDGAEIYISDPLNHYHSHLFVSRDGKWAIGDGTDGHSFAYAAPFSFDNPRVDFVPLATIHTPYVPFAGQAVDAGMSPDSRWMVYNDTIDGKKQVCAVRTDA